VPHCEQFHRSIPFFYPLRLIKSRSLSSPFFFFQIVPSCYWSLSSSVSDHPLLAFPCLRSFVGFLGPPQPFSKKPRPPWKIFTSVPALFTKSFFSAVQNRRIPVSPLSPPHLRFAMWFFLLSPRFINPKVFGAVGYSV